MAGSHLVGILGTFVINKPSILPSNQPPLGALPSRFRRERLLIIGCGDIGLRVAAQVRRHMRLFALTSSDTRVAELRAAGVTPLRGNLDSLASLRRLSGLATRVLHLAPPPASGWTDPRSLAVARALRLRTGPRSVVYGSTSGVYGDCGGDWVAETRALRPYTPRAQRRAHAESCIRFWGRSSGVRTSILRIPGIYGADRTGGTPRERLLKAVPVLQEQDDVYTNHIQADDLARACYVALWRGQAQRVYNINDDSVLKMGDYYDVAAELYGLPRPPRIPREHAAQQLPVALLSFMNESRRMVNQRMKKELRLRLIYRTVHSGLVSAQ